MRRRRGRAGRRGVRGWRRHRSGGAEVAEATYDAGVVGGAELETKERRGPGLVAGVETGAQRHVVGTVHLDHMHYGFEERRLAIGHTREPAAGLGAPRLSARGGGARRLHSAGGGRGGRPAPAVTTQRISPYWFSGRSAAGRPPRHRRHWSRRVAVSARRMMLTHGIVGGRRSGRSRVRSPDRGCGRGWG